VAPLFALKRRCAWRREDLFCNDTLRVDTQGATCSLDLLCPNTATRNPFAPRAHHSATVVGEELWLIGGCDKRYASKPLSCISTRTERGWPNELVGLTHVAHGDSMTMHDVHVLDLATLTWKEVREWPHPGRSPAPWVPHNLGIGLACR
jgi:hypothetical protein